MLFGFASGYFVGLASGLFLRGEPGPFGVVCGLRLGFASGLFFGCAPGLVCGGPASSLFFGSHSGSLRRFELGLFFRLAPGLFLRFVPGVLFCGTLGPHLRLLGVDRVPLGESLPLLGQTHL